MESANIHHKSPPQYQLVCSSTLHDASSYAAAAGSPHAAWTPNNILCNASFAAYSDAALLNSRNPTLQNDIIASDPNSSMTNKDICLDWTANRTENFTQDYHHFNGHDQLRLAQIKREFADPCDRFTKITSSSPLSGIEDVQIPPACYSNYAKELREVDDLNIKFLLRTLSTSNESLEECGSYSSPAAVTSKTLCGSQIYPTINVSELLNFHGSMGSSSAFGANLQGLDLFNSARFGGSSRQSFQEQVGLSKNSSLSYGLDFMKQSFGRPLESGSNVELLNKGFAGSKRADSNSEAKAPKAQTGTKRSRLESRAGPPFKVRKEKLGDRIAALQQLVAPFGKTDTASVLMEAIGYIKFLQNQVETLSVPYLKSSRHKNKRIAVLGGSVDNGSGERKRDLKSRGLCLVPVSCLSYITDGGRGMWPPPNFG